MNKFKLVVSSKRVLTKSPLRISGYTFVHAETLVVELASDDFIGRGEASGVYYHGETLQTMAAQVERVRVEIEAGVNRFSLQTLLPPGGARNAVDCALWELESQRQRRPIWELAGLAQPGQVVSTITISAGGVSEIASAASALGPIPRIKLKLLGDGQDASKLRAVREAQPSVWLMVDANQGLSRQGYLDLLPTMQDCNVSLVEQPFPLGREVWMDGLPRPIPVSADESFQTSSDLPGLIGRFDVASIKLDKCGGFTEALTIAAQTRELGLSLMVGCMLTSSLGTAPAYLIGGLCDVSDIDAPLHLITDTSPGLHYDNGVVTMPAGVWGL